MAYFTIELFNLLKLHARPDENISNINDMTNIAKRSIFDGAPLYLLSDVARENFVSQFCLHYFTHEIGFDTEELFKIELNGNIMCNYEQINSIYEDLARQAFTEYSKKMNASNGKRVKVGNANDVRTDNIKNNNKSTNINNVTSERDNTGSQENKSFQNNIQNNNISSTLTERGFTEQEKTGNDVTNDNGSSVNNNDLIDVVNHNTTERQTYGSQNSRVQNNKDQHVYDTSDKTNYNSTATQNYGAIDEMLANTKRTDKNIKQYDLVTEKSFDDRSHEKSFEGTITDTNDSKNDQNGMTLSFDTPQGSLDDLRNPGGVPGSGSGSSEVGKGIAYAAGQSYNYLSAAAENDNTTWNHATNEKSFDEYKETDVDNGTEINTQKFDIDGTTHKDELQVENKFNEHTIQVTENGNTRWLNGDVNMKSGADSNVKGGYDEVIKTGQENIIRQGSDVDVKSGSDVFARSGDDTTSHKGNTTQINNNKHEVVYNSGVKDNKNLDTTNISNGIISDAGTAGSTVTDDLHEKLVSSGSNVAIDEKETTGSVQNEHVESGTDVTTSDGNEELYKIDLLKWTMLPNFMDKLWPLFDDLFMWLIK